MGTRVCVRFRVNVLGCVCLARQSSHFLLAAPPVEGIRGMKARKIMEISETLLYQGHYSWLLSSFLLIGGMGILFSITQGLTFEHTRTRSQSHTK